MLLKIETAYGVTYITDKQDNDFIYVIKDDDDLTVEEFLNLKNKNPEAAKFAYFSKYYPSGRIFNDGYGIL